MPTYKYQCEHCDHSFTKFLKIADREQPLSEPCPKCSELNSITKQLESTTFIYNPSGQLRTSDNFNDRLIEIKKTKGRDNTINTRRSVI